MRHMVLTENQNQLRMNDLYDAIETDEKLKDSLPGFTIIEDVMCVTNSTMPTFWPSFK